jgi:glycerophosphoryl diester phosphodiesterase
MQAGFPIDGPLLYAHRGARLLHPENSLPAFAAALQAGADVLELDVRMSADGHVVVAHDATGHGTANVDRKVAECTLAELLRWDVGSGPAVTRSKTPVRMPTLHQVLEEMPAALLNVDLKQERPDMVPAVLQALRAQRAQERVLLTSFASAVLGRVRASGYEGPTGLARVEAMSAAFAPAVWLRRHRLPGQRLQIPMRFAGLDLRRRALIDKQHALGLAVDYWVVNDVGQAAALLELGADGIVTDDPAAMAALFAHSAHTGSWRARHPGCGRPSSSLP